MYTILASWFVATSHNVECFIFVVSESAEESLHTKCSHFGFWHVAHHIFVMKNPRVSHAEGVQVVSNLLCVVVVEVELLIEDRLALNGWHPCVDFEDCFAVLCSVWVSKNEYTSFYAINILIHSLHFLLFFLWLFFDPGGKQLSVGFVSVILRYYRLKIMDLSLKSICVIFDSLSC